MGSTFAMKQAKGRKKQKVSRQFFGGWALLHESSQKLPGVASSFHGRTVH
jgi:hypothetical protein